MAGGPGPRRGRPCGVSARAVRPTYDRRVTPLLDRFRLTEWSVPGKDFREYELYDHQVDPDENVNLANSSKYAAEVKELATLRQHAARLALRRVSQGEVSA